ncbi:STAS domain-containing protein [Marinactinospora thermotolerans DSM 45154]|uniref:Anti-sigma factor antagonist n=2 Tax=Marinactinospora thermotolerans TaxID=531310 RepID=A0A1T4TBC7_9ACTN|nr:STAS domain-containing protein [Marinactinospora thermotolerans DSM 45154]
MHAPCAHDAPLLVPAPVEIDMDVADEFGRHLTEAIAAGPRRVIVDMTRTVFCDSSGISAIMAAFNRIHAGGPLLCLAAPHPRVRRVLTIVGLDLLMPVHADLDEALTG